MILFGACGLWGTRQDRKHKPAGPHVTCSISFNTPKIPVLRTSLVPFYRWRSHKPHSFLRLDKECIVIDKAMCLVSICYLKWLNHWPGHVPIRTKWLKFTLEIFEKHLLSISDLFSNWSPLICGQTSLSVKIISGKVFESILHRDWVIKKKSH